MMMRTNKKIWRWCAALVLGAPLGYALGVLAIPVRPVAATTSETGQKPETPSKASPRFAAFDAPALPDCSRSHCSSIDSILYSICTANRWDASVRVPTREPNGTPQGKPCFCVCSCLAANTLVKVPTGTKTIQSFVRGDEVLVLSETDDKKWVRASVVSASGTSRQPTAVNYAIRIKVGGKVLISNPDHLYMTADGNLKRADRLRRGQKLRSSEFKEVEITSVAHGSFQGGFHNIVTDARADSIKGHLIDTEGVISADYFLQTSRSAQADLRSEPQVGSPQYLKQNADFMADIADLKPETNDDAGFFPAGRGDEVPNSARAFLPRTAEKPNPDLDFRAMDDSLGMQKARQLLNLWYGYYPNVAFELAWNDNTVNAFAWVDSNGQRRVKICGGLVRHHAIRWEGLALVIAHEVGHHFGGSPSYPFGLSCEGQADYWAALIGMRNVYPDEEYFAVMIPAIDQLFKLFSGGLIEDQNSPAAQRRFDADNCSHPPADCRKKTYEAGIDLKTKPACAGPAGLGLLDAPARPSKLFIHLDMQDMKLDEAQSAALRQLKSFPANKTPKLVRFANGVLTDASPDLIFNFDGDIQHHVQKVSVDNRPNSFVWNGSFGAKREGSIFVVRDGNVTGTVRADGKLYSVRPLGKGLHAVTEQEERKFPPDHPKEFDEREKKAPKDGDVRKRLDASRKDAPAGKEAGPFTLRVLVAYTPKVAEAVPDILGMIDLAVAETNQSYLNSNIRIRAELAHAVKLDYAETGDFEKDLNLFRGKDDTHMDDVHALRNTHKADVCVLLVNDSAYCGLADAILAREDSAFALVYHNCATGYYSFAHEIGHLQGARHNDAADPTVFPFPHGHGCCNAGEGWRTIMSYDCGGASRLPYWSNPEVKHPTTGTAMGTKEREDNARVLNETAPLITGFRP